MKELSIEEKAQRYDDAINAIKELKAKHPTALVIKDWIKENFPELKESEDEKIRKELLQIAKESEDSFYMVMTPDKRKHLIDWLEKQGEHKKFRDSIQVGDKVTRNQDGMLVNLSQLKRIAKPNETKQGEQNSDWSEEDKEKLNRIYMLLPQCIDCHPRIIGDRECVELQDWLKSLKDRVQPQLKQEWSKEDESLRLRTIGALETCKIGSPTKCVDEQINWLKSIKERYTWKPSDEQMEALWKVYKGGEEQATLASLYSDLKRLLKI